MKILFLILIVFSLQATGKSQTNNSQTVKSQPLPEWFRVYTYDDSIIELNTNYVMFSNYNVERVRFRWSFQMPQCLDKNSEVEYQSILQEVQFDCQNKTFRLYAVQWYDTAGKQVASRKNDDSEKLQQIQFGSMMEKLYLQACKLIKLRKREPAVEK